MEKQIQNVASPEVASLMRYSDFSDLDYIGKTNVSIPIYNIKFGKLNIPIGLSYNTKGNKVADIATSVGLGWNLNAGGNLTVKVNDQNDFTESYSYYSEGGFEAEMSFAWHRQSRGYLSTEFPDQLFYSNISGQQLCINPRISASDDKFIDAAPDFYYLNAPGLEDKFYLSRIDATHFKANFFNLTKTKLNNVFNLIIKPTCGGYESTYWGNSGKATVFYQPDKFEFKAENGYIYTFNDFENSIIREYPETFISHYDIQVNNWYLTKIKDPISGREINFEYEGYVNDYEHPALRTSGYLNFGNYNVTQNYTVGNALSIYEPPPLIHNRLTTSTLKPKRIKRILTDEETVNFNYSFPRQDYPGNGLSSINVINKNNLVIKEVAFNYSYFNSSNCTSGDYECKRLKLDNITDSTLGTYNFYYTSDNFPSRTSSKVDFLGYFNDNSSNIIFSKDNYQPYNGSYYQSSSIYFYPDLEKDNLFPFLLTNKASYATTNGIDRTPSIKSKLGVLQKLVYPTGGSLELNYENDDFIYEDQKYILGSIRVGGMKLYDSQNVLSKEIKYKYINENNKSSGQINFITTPVNSLRTEIASGIGFNTGAIIGYSRIIEETIGKGSVEKKYTNFNDYPDKFMQPVENIDQGVKNMIKFFKFPQSYMQSFDGRRGKLLSVNYYKEGSSSPIKKELYTYDYQVKDSIKVQKVATGYDYAGNPSSGFTASNYLLHYFNNLKTTSKEDIFANGSVKEENSYNYDDARVIYKKTASGGDITEEYYRNAKDKSIQKLIDANILDKAVEIEKKLNGKTLAKQEVKYENSTNLLPSSELSYDLKTSLMGTDITYDKYDNKGNLLQYRSKDNIPVTIIWGYRQSKPIAKIEGANYSQIMQVFGLNANDNNAYLNLDIVKKSDLHFGSTTEAELLSKLKDFGSKSELKDFNISTYTHAPLVGVKSMTSPSGLRDSYSYDSANRLEKITNNEDKIVKEYKYNYAPTSYYSSEKSQVFTRNNCGSSATGGTYTYIVPAYQYSSIISPADADQKALNDINTNGQNQANINGTCTTISCGLSFNSSIGISGGGSVSGTSNSYYKLSFGFSSGSNSTNLPWTTGVKIATITGNCKPLTEYSSYNGQVYYTIKTNGEVILKTHFGTIYPNNSSHSYEFYFPTN